MISSCKLNLITSIARELSLSAVEEARRAYHAALVAVDRHKNGWLIDTRRWLNTLHILEQERAHAWNRFDRLERMANLANSAMNDHNADCQDCKRLYS